MESISYKGPSVKGLTQQEPTSQTARAIPQRLKYKIGADAANELENTDYNEREYIKRFIGINAWKGNLWPSFLKVGIYLAQKGKEGTFTLNISEASREVGMSRNSFYDALDHYTQNTQYCRIKKTSQLAENLPGNYTILHDYSYDTINGEIEDGKARRLAFYERLTNEDRKGNSEFIVTQRDSLNEITNLSKTTLKNQVATNVENPQLRQGQNQRQKEIDKLKYSLSFADPSASPDSRLKRCLFALARWICPSKDCVLANFLCDEIYHHTQTTIEQWLKVLASVEQDSAVPLHLTDLSDLRWRVRKAISGLVGSSLVGLSLAAALVDPSIQGFNLDPWEQLEHRREAVAKLERDFWLHHAETGRCKRCKESFAEGSYHHCVAWFGYRREDIRLQEKMLESQPSPVNNDLENILTELNM